MPRRQARTRFPTRRFATGTLTLALLLALAACGNGQGYPSLARRPAELVRDDGGRIAPCAGWAPAAADAAGAQPPSAKPCPTLPAHPLPGQPGRLGGEAAVVASEPVTPTPEGMGGGPDGGDLTTRLDRLVTDAHANAATFAQRRAEAEARVGAADGAAPGTEAWSVATEALSALETQRTATATALAELDSIDIADRMAHDDADARSGGPANRPDGARIAAARAAIEPIVTDEDQVLDRLRARLPN